MTNKGGRPPDAGVPRKRQYAVRVTPDEERAILELAAKNDWTVSETLRACITTGGILLRNPHAFGMALGDEKDVEVQRVVQERGARGGRRPKPA